MKFGYFCNTTNWKHKPYDQLLNETKEITTYCDENNWDSIWYTEHHFNHEGMESCTNPRRRGVDAAARTKQMRIGQACNVITFHNPIRLAEDIALLDQLSNGQDNTNEISKEDLEIIKEINLTSNPKDLDEADVYIVTVPTPIDENKKPELSPLLSASEIVGNSIARKFNYYRQESLSLYSNFNFW